VVFANIELKLPRASSRGSNVMGSYVSFVRLYGEDCDGGSTALLSVCIDCSSTAC
jgi:hypothetical protein